MQLKMSSYHILRVGMAITFLWIGVLIWKEPGAWGGLLEPWAAGLLPIPLKEAMIGTAVLDILIGFFLLVDVWTWLFALIGAIHLVIILLVTGITIVTVRDIGLFVAMISLAVDSWPAFLSKKK